MRVTFDLPDLGEGLTEAEIIEWKVDVGDQVGLDQEIVEVSTAKAVVVIPSPHAGVVAELHGAAGDVLDVGAPLISFEVEGGEGSTVPAEPPAVVASDSAETTPSDRSPNLVGYGVAEDTVDTGRRRRRHAVGAPQVATVSSASAPDAATRAADGSRPLAKPPVRKLARELGIDLAAIPGTGPGGVVTRDDVHAAAEATPQPAPSLDTPDAAGAQTRLVPVRGVRRNIAARMEASGAIPAAAAWQETRADGLLELRDELNEARPDARITPFAIVLRVVVAALREVPMLNTHYSDEGILVHGSVHLGVAASTDRGLLVPVIRDADRKSIWDLNDELRRLTTAARNRTIAPTELIGSTFTVTNYGALGLDGGIPLINAPEVGILGIGAIRSRAVVTRKGKVRKAPTAQLTLSFDHRVADGAEAARFVGYVAERIADRGTLVGSL